MNAYTIPACVERNKPRTIGASNFSIAIPKVMSPIASIINILYHKRNSSRRNPVPCPWDGILHISPANRCTMIPRTLLVTRIHSCGNRIYPYRLIIALLKQLQGMRQLVNMDSILLTAKICRRPSRQSPAGWHQCHPYKQHKNKGICHHTIT